MLNGQTHNAVKFRCTPTEVCEISIVKKFLTHIRRQNWTKGHQNHWRPATLSLQKHWYMPSSHPVLMAAIAMPCWPGRHSSKASTDRLQRVLSAAARVVSGTHKFDRCLTHLLHSELHWLDVPQRIQFKLGVTRSSVSAGQCSPVPCRLLQVHNRCGQSPAAPLSKSPSAHRTTTSSHQLRPSGV